MDCSFGGIKVKISVIVPVYNVEEYLRKCLDSLVNQTLEELEILVVNDGSPDNSQIIIDEFVKKYPQKVKGLIKENGGQASARNMALDIAKGEFIGFVDSDDWVDLDMFEKMYQKAKDNGSDMVICNTVDHYQDHDVYHRQSDVGAFRKCGSSCNKIFSRELVGDMRFPEGLWYEDFCFSIKLSMRAKNISFCEEHFYHAFSRPVSTMNNNNTLKNLTMLTVMEDISKFVTDNNLQEKFGYDLEYMMIEHVLITSINRVAVQKTKERPQVIKKLRKFVLSKYKHFWRDPAFKEFAKNYRIIAMLNAFGLWRVSSMIFSMKSGIKKLIKGA